VIGVADLFSCPLTRRDLHFRECSAETVPVEPWRVLGERHGLGPLVGTLETADRATAYPVWKDIIGLLPEFARSADAAASRSELGDTKRSVARFYDEFGWVEGAAGGYFNDALTFEDLRPLTAFYRARCHRRVNRVLAGGKYLLDVASGPVQIPEYVSFSQAYEKRICVDISVIGLLHAKRRLGEHAICVIGDITALPLRTDTVDGLVSLHTVYHVPAQEQSTAIAELHRVLRPGGRGAIVYSWGGQALVYRMISRIARWLRAPATAAAPATTAQASMPLYFHPQGYAWFQSEIEPRFPLHLRVWRSLDKGSLEYLARGRISAALVLWPLYALEQMFPRLFGRIGVCPMFVMSKASA